MEVQGLACFPSMLSCKRYEKAKENISNPTGPSVPSFLEPPQLERDYSTPHGGINISSFCNPKEEVPYMVVAKYMMKELDKDIPKV